jgi:hypothetical protein
MSDDGEIGPLDVQIRKRDELGDVGSGLIVSDALADLQKNALETWRECTLDIVTGTQNQVSFKTAAEIATRITVGVFSPIYGQIDPMHMGEVHRLMNIGREYGNRLRLRAANISEENLNHLVEDYPDHGFAIDRAEASLLFQTVSEPTTAQVALIDCLGKNAERPVRSPIIGFLSEPLDTSGKSESEQSEIGKEARVEDVQKGDREIRARQEHSTNNGGNEQRENAEEHRGDDIRKGVAEVKPSTEFSVRNGDHGGR